MAARLSPSGVFLAGLQAVTKLERPFGSPAQVIPDGAGTDVIFTATTIDSLGGAALVTNRVLIPSPGVYLIVANLLFDTVGAEPIEDRLNLLRNGLPIMGTDRRPDGAGSESLGLADVVALDAGDAISLQAEQTNAGALPRAVLASALSVVGG